MKDLIKAIRFAANMNQEQFASALGTTPLSINRWENGKTLPNRMAQTQLYNFCKEQVIFTYDKRKDYDYVGSIECWDASIQQLRGGVWDSKIDEMFTEKYNKVRDIMRKDMLKFGFIEGV